MPDPMLKRILTLPTDDDARAVQQFRNANDAVERGATPGSCQAV